MSIDFDNATFSTMPRPDRIKPRAVRKQTRFERWAWSPVVSFQIGLTLSYLGLIFFGTTSFIANVPVFQITAPEWWSQYWATALGVGGIMGFFGSIHRRKSYETLELFGSAISALALGSYALSLLVVAYGIGDVDRATSATSMVVLTIPFLVRTLWLSSQSLRR